MPSEKNLSLKDINSALAENRSGHRKITEVSICFVPVVSSYDDELTNSNSFFMSLNLSSTPEVKITKNIRVEKR